jgi:hypothetical protein
MPRHAHFRSIALMALACATTPTLVHAQTQPWVRFLATELEVQETPLATVPPSTTTALLQSRISSSPSGNYWSSVFITSQDGNLRRAVVSGTRSGIDFSLGQLQTIPGINEAFESSAVGLDMDAYVNDAGDIAMSGNFVPTTNDEAIVLYRRSNQTYSLIAREGSPIPGIPGESFGGGLDQRQLLSDGRVVFRDGSTTGGLASSVDEFIFAGGPAGASFAPLYQGGVTVATGLADGTNLVISDVENGYGASNDGQFKLSRVILQRAAPNVALLVNNQVVLEQGQPLPGSPTPTPEFSTAVTISDAGMNARGDWWATGRGLTGGAPWMVRNGQVIYTSDGGFPGGAIGEKISSVAGVNITSDGTLHFSALTSFTRYVVVVVPPNQPGFLAMSDAFEIDLNNNGDPGDDGFFAQTIFSAHLSDDGTLYMILRRNGIGDVVGWAPIPLRPACGIADFASTGGAQGPDGILDNNDFIVFIQYFFELDFRADIGIEGGASGSDTIFDNNDFIVFIQRFFEGC